MCELNKRFFLYLLLVLLFVSVAGALRAEEQAPWYLISETELRSIEQYREKSEQEKQNWLLQARALKGESANLNAQLAQAREQNRRLEQSFNKSEADRLMRLSLKNGEIAGLKEEAAKEKLEKEKYKGLAADRLIIIIAGTVMIGFLIALKVLRFFKIV